MSEEQKSPDQPKYRIIGDKVAVKAEDLVALEVREFPHPTNTRDNEWDRDYVTVMASLDAPGELSPEMRAKARDLIAHMLEQLGGTIPYCIRCKDGGNVETDRGSWVRCPDCR